MNKMDITVDSKEKKVVEIIRSLSDNEIDNLIIRLKSIRSKNRV